MHLFFECVQSLVSTRCQHPPPVGDIRSDILVIHQPECQLDLGWHLHDDATQKQWAAGQRPRSQSMLHAPHSSPCARGWLLRLGLPQSQLLVRKSPKSMQDVEGNSASRPLTFQRVSRCVHLHLQRRLALALPLLTAPLGRPPEIGPSVGSLEYPPAGGAA